MAESLRTQIAREIHKAVAAYPEGMHVHDRSARDIARYRRMLEVLGLPLDTELVLATLTDAQCNKLLRFLRIYNKPNKTRYDWINLEAMIEDAAADA